MCNSRETIDIPVSESYHVELGTSDQTKQQRNTGSSYTSWHAGDTAYWEPSCDTLFEEHDTEALAAIVEKLNETIEREQVRKKIEYLKAYFKNTLMNPVKAIEKEINGQEGYPEYIDWWQRAFAFNTPTYFKVVSDYYGWNRVCSDEEADYIFNLLQDKIGIPVLLIEENLELIEKERPDLYLKLKKAVEDLDRMAVKGWG